jgi:SNF2 family DNA or RNA helicase
MLVNISYHDRHFYFWGITDHICLENGENVIESDLKVIKKIVQKCSTSHKFITSVKEFVVTLPTKQNAVDVTGTAEHYAFYKIKAYGVHVCGFDPMAPSRIKKEFPKKGLFNIHFSNSFMLTHLLMRVAGELIDSCSYYPKIFKTDSSRIRVKWCLNLDDAERFYVQMIAEKMPKVFFLLSDKPLSDFIFIRDVLDQFIHSVISKTHILDEHALKKTPVDEVELIRSFVEEVSSPIPVEGDKFSDAFLEDLLLSVNQKICDDNFPYKPAIQIIPNIHKPHHFKKEICVYSYKQDKTFPLSSLCASKKNALFELLKLKRKIKRLELRFDGQESFSIEDMSKQISFLKDLQIETGCHIVLPQGMTHIPVAPSVNVDIETNEEGMVSLFTPSAIANVKWSFLLGDQSITLEELQELADQKKTHYIKNEILIPVNAAQLQTFLKQVHKLKKQSLTPFDLLKADVGMGLDYHLSAGWIKKIFSKLKGFEPIKELPQPETLKATLRPYQIRGFSWLVFMRECGLGACLADDMGLGKTIQTIAYILHIKEKGLQKKPFLLVCPTSLLSNWQRELFVFAPSVKVYVHHGADRDKNIENDYDIIITSYSLVDKDLKHLKTINWESIILDEAQNIKNAETKQTKAVKSLKGNHRIILTGTPVENKPSDIWSLMDFVNHGLLGSKSWFSSRYSKALSYSQKEEMQEQSKKIALQLKAVVGPFMLRRLKTDKSIIMDLPEKIHHRIICPLSVDQTSLYKACVDDMLKRLDGSSGIERRGLIFTTLLKLKQICNHPAHFTKIMEGSSGKLDVLYDLLEDILGAGEKMLIFTQFKEMGEMLVKFLSQKTGLEILFLNGSTPAKMRGDMVKDFQEKDRYKIFILSLKAGGIGLNLTAANHVIHYDRWWNPAVEEQATSRAHRIGQDKIVSVHTFICEGTIEDRIDMMIQQKIALAGNVIGEGEGWITELNDQELKNLLTLKEIV